MNVCDKFELYVWFLELCYRCKRAGICNKYATRHLYICGEFEQIKHCLFCKFYDVNTEKCTIEVVE